METNNFTGIRLPHKRRFAAPKEMVKLQKILSKIPGIRNLIS
jgi:hypothetical protein